MDTPINLKFNATTLIMKSSISLTEDFVSKRELMLPQIKFKGSFDPLVKSTLRAIDRNLLTTKLMNEIYVRNDMHRIRHLHVSKIRVELKYFSWEENPYQHEIFVYGVGYHSSFNDSKSDFMFEALTTPTMMEIIQAMLNYLRTS